MENQQAVSFLASLVDVMVRAVKEEVLQSLDKDALITKAIHSAVDYDETFWQRITNHVDKSQEKIESNVKDWLATELPHQLEHFKGSGSSGELVTKDRLSVEIENWMDTYLEDRVGDQMGDWMDSNLNDRMDTWMNDNFNLEDYGDIDDKIRDYLRNEASFTVSVD